MTPEQMQQIAEREYPYIGEDSRAFYSKHDITGIQQQAFIHGLTYSKWVKVEDGCKMPERDPLFEDEGLDETIHVNVTVDSGNVFTAYYSYTEGCWLYYNSSSKVRGIVTAWQPLPEPYKK